MSVPVLIIASVLLILAPVSPALRLVTARGHTRMLKTKTPRDGPVDRHRIASDIELFAACYRAGLPTLTAAEAVAETYAAADASTSGETQPWIRLVSYLRLGIDSETAWEVMDGIPGCEELASLVALSHSSGSALADGCDRIAGQLRDRAADDASAAAERAGVLISIPLAAFFLPAFFVLGLAPVVIGLGAEMFTQ
ncbi:type II secretion system F family protein [Corynebacterium aquatimens]|uniref:Pilus assembly protein TadC n=1 Tax=Corynebacterium aquatimens TaxID=1190508 RepID=A0A931E1I8_9CORY|nr:type II secretion system F family protein [Corynebacterium aquatimens]MBG6122528.1 pilus assembly protein TadC [Corynebacterium aquatimens]WJY64932.1 Bacterial type II secretion system protein F domain protein [Corynebacterium aquatimens]